MFLYNQQVTEEIKREIKKISQNKWRWKLDNSKPMGCSKSSSKREVYSNTILPQETRKTSNRQPNFTPKTTGLVIASFQFNFDHHIIFSDSDSPAFIFLS